MSSMTERDKIHPFIQFLLNCALSAILAGITFGIGNAAFDMNWPGKVYWGLFVLWLLACYGVWFIFIHKKDNSDSVGGGNGGGGSGWSDLLDFD